MRRLFAGLLGLVLASCAPRGIMQVPSPLPVPDTPTPTSEPTGGVPCPPPIGYEDWDLFPKEGLELLTTDGSFVVEALPPQGDESVLRFSFENGEVIDDTQKNNLDEFVNLHRELHFGIQTWVCGEQTFFRYVPPNPSENPIVAESRACTPALQMLDVQKEELVEPEWEVWDLKEKTFLLVQDQVTIRFFIEDGMVKHIVEPFEYARAFAYPATLNSYGEALLSFYVVAAGAAWGPISFYFCPDGPVYVTGSFTDRYAPFQLPGPDQQA